ncbi:hypothetical protein [uncultured Psychrosphaera sp.]|jgi:hypothetical protein|uniref:hypothetical protein n=1 Tax=uncultured Psychrosphaera sp. TaxID=1403522 RepID=UPI0026032507|nr:hypothetical protein [uncultured Psychrosphaera sp.]
MSQSPSDEDLGAVYQYRDLLLISWPEIEEKVSINIQDSENDFKYIKEIFVVFLEFSAKKLSRKDIVWSSTSWLFHTLIEEKTSIFEEVDMEQYYKLINLFRHNESTIFEHLYAEDMDKIDEILKK